MRTTSTLLAFLLATGCTVSDPLYCDEDRPCTDPDRPFCDLNGDYPSSGSIARTCIPEPDVEAPPDAGPADGSVDKTDARVFEYPAPDIYWAFDARDITGTVVVAREGAASGDLQGTSADTAGVAGEAIAFAGGADHVDFGDVLDDVLAGPDQKFTISVWIKPASVTGENMILVKAGTLSCTPSEENLQLDLLLVDGIPSFRYWTPSNQNARYVLATTPLVLDVWQHLLLTYDGASDVGAIERLRLYVNGVPQPLSVDGSLGTFPYDIQPTDAHLALGKIVGASGEPCGPEQLNGALDELAVWSAVLSAEHAADVYARGSAALSLWPL
jgi:hypothetical protein